MTIERSPDLREREALEAMSDHLGSGFQQTLMEVEPYFLAKPVIYIDAGARDGHAFRKVYESRLNLQSAHLIEPDPTLFAALETTVRELGAEAVVTCHNAAAPQTLAHQKPDTTTRAGGTCDGTEAITVDALLPMLPEPHASILRVDVEGHEREGLVGVATLLGTRAVDLIYVEADLEQADARQTYHHDLEDMLRGRGYQLFRIYGQRRDKAEAGSPRRIHLAFITQAFAAEIPYELSHELLAARQEYEALRTSMKAAEAVQDASSREGHVAHDLRKQVDGSQERLQTLDAESGTEAPDSDAVAEATARSMREIAQSKDDIIQLLRAQIAGHERKQEALRAASRDLIEMRRYAAQLEQRLGDLLGSTTWRAMGPVRRLMQLVRRQEASPAFVPSLARDSDAGLLGLDVAGPTFASDGQTLADRAERLLNSSSQVAVRSLIANERKWADRPGNVDEFFLSKFARLLAYSRYSSHSEVVKAFDEIRERIGPDLRWFRERVGNRVLVRFMTVSSAALTRDHRYEEARQLVDAVIKELGERSELLRYRAEMCWPHDPEQARADLLTCSRRGELPGNWAVFRAYLEWRAGNLTPDMIRASEDQRSQMRLVLALAALDRDDFASYREELNAFFEHQGLLGPVPADASRFDFAALGSHLAAERSKAEPLVSVIMTTFNSAATVAYAVRSILAQTHANLELFIVDDRSSDETPRLLAELAAADPRIKVLHNETNSGTYLAKNRAMEQATGTYVTFHDSDDWAHPERLARHLQVMEADPELVASRSEWLRVTDWGEVRFHRWGHKFQHLNPASTFLRREVIEAIGYFDNVRYAADTEYWYRLWHRFGIDRTRTLPLCLGLGAFHNASLTQSGTGAMGLENYSPVRGAYTASYLEWHATSDREALWRPARARDRAFWAPPEMLIEAAGGESTLTEGQGSGGAKASSASS